ncbi:MAG TPA: redoxin domain-containing protein [Caulobacteraceae bacterium]|nr:redoxin domain-containing protein [Caulobacteraceae bacterium]
MLTRRHLGLAAAAALLAGGGAVAQGAMAQGAGPVIGQPAPAFSAVDANGQTRSLAQYRGKTVVLEWTNHECPYVKKHYSGNMQALQRAATADGVVWLSIVSSAPGEQGHVTGAQAKALTTSRNAAPTAVLLDPEGRVGRLYGAKTTPHMFVINPQGQVVYAGGIDDVPTNKVEDLKRAKPLVQMALADLKAGRKVAVPASRPYGCAVKYKA